MNTDNVEVWLSFLDGLPWVRGSLDQSSYLASSAPVPSE